MPGGLVTNLDAFYSLISLHSQVYNPVVSQHQVTTLVSPCPKILNASVARIAVFFNNVDASNHLYLSIKNTGTFTNYAWIIPPQSNMYFYFAIHGSIPMHDWFACTDVGATFCGTVELIVKDVREIAAIQKEFRSGNRFSQTRGEAVQPNKNVYGLH
jgi:hypothetical protein